MSDHLLIHVKHWSEDVLLAGIRGDLTHETHAQLEEQVQVWLDKGILSFVFDLTNVTRLSNTGAGVLVNQVRAVQDRGGRVTLVEPSPAALETLELLGVMQFLHVVQSADEAKEFHGVV